MRDCKNIILVGYMGCGKSTVGKNLAKVCNYTFLDTDEYIEEKQKMKISEIFETQGEPSFRDMETDCINEMIATKATGLVISTGGGMAVREENRRLLKQLGTVVFLRVKPETVYERIKGDTTRPLLQCEDPLSKIKTMIAERTPFYEDAADIVIDVDELKQCEISLEIRNLMGGSI